MPSLGADMEAGTLVEWLKNPGNAVRRGDVVAVVETQKGTIEIVETQVLDSALVQPGEKVPVGRPLASLRGNGVAQEPEPAPPQPPPEVPPSPEQPPPAPPPERPPAPAPEIPPGVPPEVPPSPEQPPVEIPEPEAKGGIRVRMRLAARRRAAELSINPVRSEARPRMPQFARRCRAGRQRRAGSDPRCSGTALGVRSGRDARGDLRRHGTLQTRDPALCI
jgi:pyruvate dehydrogenase E2 component (dihydrolipoamide acetyltransferase)